MRMAGATATEAALRRLSTALDRIESAVDRRLESEGHAAGLEDQTLAAGKLDSYFMLGRHRVLFSVFSLEKLVVGRRRRLRKSRRGMQRLIRQE